MEKTEIGPEAFLMPANEAPETPDEDTSTPETDEVVEADEAEEDAAEAQESDEAADEEQQDEPDDSEQAPELYTVKVDGEEVRVTLDELRRSYSGQSFIRKGMQEAAEAKRQAQEAFKSLQAAQERVLEFSQKIEQQGFIREPQFPDPSKFKNDPIGLNEAMANYWTQNREYQTQQKQIAEVREQQERAQMAALEAHLAEERERVLEAVPEFADEGYKKDLAQYAIKAGYAPQEVAALVDGRAVQILNKAMLYDRQQAEMAKARQAKLTPENRTVKPSAKRPEPPQLARGKIIAKAKASGKDADWLAAFKEPTSR